MARRMSTAWIKPTSLDRALMVDREAEVEEIVEHLRDQIDGGERSYTYYVTGERGVGKSILSLKAIDTLRDTVGELLIITVAARALRFEGALRQVARQLAEALNATDDPALAGWGAELSLLADNARINASQVEETSRTAGMRGEASAGGLLLKLKSMFHWSRTQKTGSRIDLVREVDDQLLQAAIARTLEQIATTPYRVLAFFDDIDQLSTTHDALEATFKQVLSLQPCITVAHVRRACLPEDLRREFDFGIEIMPLTRPVLVELLRARHDAANLGVRGLQDPATWAALSALAAGTGNPYTLLRWVQAFAATIPFPTPVDWASLESLGAIATRAAMTAGEPLAELRKLATLIDESALDGRHVTRADLVRPGDALSPAAFDRYVRLGLLLPRNRSDADTPYRVDPLLDLLRPSVAERVLGAA